MDLDAAALGPPSGHVAIGAQQDVPARRPRQKRVDSPRLASSTRRPPSAAAIAAGAFDR